MQDDDINDFFSGFFEDKLVIKKVKIIVETEENPMLIQGEFKPFESKEKI